MQSLTLGPRPVEGFPLGPVCSAGAEETIGTLLDPKATQIGLLAYGRYWARTYAGGCAQAYAVI
jgi:hypothetical protein